MLGPLSNPHMAAVVSLAASAARDCVLVSSCGARQEVSGFLLALHSPLLAFLLVQGKTGVSLPLSLSEVRGLVSLLQGEQGQEGGQAAELLGIAYDRLTKVDDPEKMDSADINPVIVKQKVIPKFEKIMMQEAKEHGLDFSQNMSMWEAEELLWRAGWVDPDVEENKTHLKELTIGEEMTNRGEPKINNKSSDYYRSSINESKLGTDEVKKNGRMFLCKSCTFNCPSKIKLMEHMYMAHGFPIQCKICDLEFPEYSLLKKHKMKNHPTFICNLCGVAKYQRSLLDQHVEREHQDKVKCPHCELFCNTRSVLKQHINRLHSIKLYEKCIKCDYQSHVQKEMVSHFKRRHTDDLKEVCNHCGEIFKGLKRHLRRTGCGGEVTLQQFPCSQCDKIFYVNPELQRHIKTVHQGLKDRKCTQCSYSTSNGYNLRVHITTIHVGEKVTKQDCPHCDKLTTNLDHHINIWHNEHFLGKSTSSSHWPFKQ